jgi:predicted DNA-binding transcriptional regulator AlpA
MQVHRLHVRAAQIHRPHGFLQIGRSTWFDWVKKKRVPAGKRIGGVTVWDLEEVLLALGLERPNA